MKITGVTTILAHPGVGKNLCFVKIDTDEGIHGWGAVLHPVGPGPTGRGSCRSTGALPGGPRPFQHQALHPDGL